MMDLRELTRELHHAAEQHPFGTKMSSGDVTNQEWADWVASLHCVHTVLDASLPPSLDRRGELLLDLGLLLPVRGIAAASAAKFANSLTDPDRIIGAAYIFMGAHLRGGAVIRKRLEPKGLPCNHLRFAQAKEANDYIVALRDISHAAAGATAAFRAIIEIMDELAYR